jgi:hypothetical protein
VDEDGAQSVLVGAAGLGFHEEHLTRFQCRRHGLSNPP